MLKKHPFISDAVIIGDRRKYLTCLISLNDEVVHSWKMKCRFIKNHDKLLRRLVQSVIDNVNKHLSHPEKIKKFNIVPRNFDQEHGELTAALKVKRTLVQEHFKDLIEEMYK